MKRFFTILFSVIFVVSAAQSRIEVGAFGHIDFPLSSFKWRLNESLEQNGGARKSGWGLNAFAHHHPFQYFYYGLDIRYAQNKVDYTNLFSRLDYFIQNSSNSLSYDQNRYGYYLRGDYWFLAEVSAPIGIEYHIKKLTFAVNLKIGVMIACGPKIFVDEFETNITAPPNQSLSFVRNMDVFSAKPNVLFSYGSDLRIGYEVYKNVNVFVGCTYTGTINCNTVYFNHPVYGYHKTIQAIGCIFGGAYILAFKRKPHPAGVVLRK